MKDKIWITGDGMVGKALVKTLSNEKKYEVIVTNRKTLIKQAKKTDEWIKKINQI